jgi:hypothetical protein
MKNFKAFREKLEEALMRGSGAQGARHVKKYITPYLNKPDSHVLGRNAGPYKAGDSVTIHSHEEENGSHFATVSKNGGEKVKLNISGIHKPQGAAVQKNKAGFDKENELAEKLKQHGLMDKNTKTAGSTGGVDFHVINKKTSTKHLGSSAHTLGGESKISLKAKMGAIALSHTPEKGWHVSERSAKAKPHFASSIEKATVNGKPLLNHLNEHWGAPTAEKHLKNVTTDATDLHPVHAYLSDHKVDILHIHTHGTFRGGLSEKKDRTGMGLPKPAGTGRFTVGRERAGGTVNAAFRVHSDFSKSHVDLMNDEHLTHIKKKIGID